MEVVMQWLDELDDVVSMVAAKSESLRRMWRMVAVSVIAGMALMLGAAATLMQPVVAPAFAGLLGLAFLQRRRQDRAPAKL